MSSTTTKRRPRGCGKSRAVESEENQKQVFLPSHRPWKSRTTRAIPTFPTAPTAAGIYQTTSGNLIVVDRKECLTPDRGRTNLARANRRSGRQPCVLCSGRTVRFSLPDLGFQLPANRGVSDLDRGVDLPPAALATPHQSRD